MKSIKSAGLALVLAGLAVPAMAQDGYLVRPGDRVTVEVLQDADLNRTVTVLPDGRFSFPLAGTVRASGRTIGQIQSAVSAAISSNFQSPPDVFISVEPDDREEPVRSVVPEAPETINIYFLGEIGAPGPKQLLEGTTILQALSASGGFTNFAATKRVQLRRTNAHTGLQSVYEINYEALANGAQLRNDVALQEGDVILVPERRLFE